MNLDSKGGMRIAYIVALVVVVVGLALLLGLVGWFAHLAELAGKYD